MAKREQTRIQFDHVQVDICPEQAGMILSVGSISMLLPEPTVREIVHKLQDGLRDSSPSIAVPASRGARDGSN